MPHIDSPLQEPHPRHASATIVTTEREYIPPKPPTRNILPRGSPHKRTPIGQRAGVSAVWDRPAPILRNPTAPLRNRLRSGRAERAAPLGRPSSSEHDRKRCRQLRPPPLGAAALRRWPAAGERRWLAAGCNSANFRQSVNKY